MILRLRYLLLLFTGIPAMAQTTKTGLKFTSSKNQFITVYKGTIFVNGNKAYQLGENAVNLSSRRNKIIEDKGNVFLFLEIDGSPKKNRLYVFGINNSSADSLVSTIAGDVLDYDHDGNMEFGGSDVQEAHPSPDSMYYTPARFYEINRGRIIFDADYTEKAEKKLNGVYISDPMENGKCCKVIPKPKH